MPEFDPVRFDDITTTAGTFNPQFAWENIPINFGTFQPPVPRGMTMQEAIRQAERDIPLRRGRPEAQRAGTKPVMPVAERVIEFTIEKEDTGRYYIISAIVVNDKNKVIDQWTASTEEDADSMVAQMAETFMRSGMEGIPMNLRHRDRIRQRGHLTRDDRASLRRNDRDEVAEDSFALDIDEDAIIADQIDKKAQELERIARLMDANVPF